jgi:hypothetical protein
MNMKKRIAFGTILLSVILSVTSCQSDSDGMDDRTKSYATVPTGSALILDKDFQESGAWPSVSTNLIGYSATSDSSGSSNLISDTAAYSWEEIYFNGVNNDTVLIDYTDVAVNTTCEEGAGLSAEGKDISTGFVLFNKKTARSGEVTPTMVLSKMAYVSTVQFTLSVSSVTGKGLALYKSVDGAAYKKVGTYLPESSTTGEYYSVAVNDSNVSLKFVSEDVNNEYIRMHDLKVSTGGVPSGSVLYVEDYFGSWNLQGYVLPVPGVAANKTGTQYVPLASLGTVEYDTTITYVSGVPVSFTVHDAAVNPDCYNHHGDTSLVYGLTTGYIELPINKTAYANTNINASFTISAVPSVSLLECWFAVTGFSGRYQIYKSVNGGDYTLFKDLIVPKYAGIGKYFRFYVNEENVSFKFTTYQGTGAYTTTPKLYGVRIWSDGKP